MNKFFITICLALVAIAANAQTITDVLRRDQQGQGKVVINQSADIERLVNNRQQNTTTNNSQQTIKPVEKAYNQQQVEKTGVQQQDDNANKSNQQQERMNNLVGQNGQKDNVAGTPTERPNERANERTTTRQNTVPNYGYETESPTVSTNKKIMRHSYKTTGYRIQVYTGGNKREDRTKCEQIAARLKTVFPNEPIYVHFYSPSWKCRMGNFTNMNEAKTALKQVRNMGYNQACLVKGTINVQY